MLDYDLSVSAPGRICLFGEHQDYFGLSIIAAAINRRISISGKPTEKRQIEIELPDVDDTQCLPLDKELNYQKERDYLRSGLNVLQRRGLRLPDGWECLVRGNIPINSGTASSSALVVAWVRFLLEAGDAGRAGNPEEIAELAFQSEVAEFGEPGGKMDHYASAVGGIVSIHFGETMRLEKLQNPLKTFVLADSMQRKNTTGTLGFIKSHVFRGIEMVRQKIEDFDVNSTISHNELKVIEGLPDNERRLLLGTMKTRDLTKEGRALFQADVFDHIRFGELLTEQQTVLRENLGVSTERIEQLLAAARDAGAYGGKINGSGQGGCIFAYTPEHAEDVLTALNDLGAEAHIVDVDSGVRLEESRIKA